MFRNEVYVLSLRGQKIAGGLVAVVLALTACSSKEVPGAGYAHPPKFKSVASPYNNPSDGDGTASPEPPAPSARIVVRECAPGDASTLVVLDFIDPTRRAATEYRAFYLPATVGTTSAALCGSSEPVAAQRSVFNADYTLLALVATKADPSGVQPNSSQVVVARGGPLTTRRPTGVSQSITPATIASLDVVGTPAYSGAAFGPDGRVYFRKTKLDGTFAIESVGAGSTTARSEPTPADMQVGGNGGLYFLPGCSLPQEIVVEKGACTPDSKTEFNNTVSGTESQVRAGNGKPYTIATSGDPDYPNAVWPFAVLSPDSFLADDNNGTLYRADRTIAPGNEFALTAIVLPPSGVGLSDPALSPDGKTIAVLALDGGEVYLCVNLAASGNTLEQVVQYTIGQNLGTATSIQLLGWVAPNN